MVDEDENEERIKDCINIGGYQVCGIRTFIIALVVLVPFSILCFQDQKSDLLFAAATMVLSFFFGMKTEEKNEEISQLKTQIMERKLKKEQTPIKEVDNGTNDQS